MRERERERERGENKKPSPLSSKPTLLLPIQHLSFSAERILDMSASPELRRLSPELVLPTPAVARRLPPGYHHQSSASPPPAKEKTDLLEEDRFRTPTTAESKLNSAPSICPPAPVKLRRGAGCKRKLLELEFFRVEAEEIERLFRPIPATTNLQSFRRRKQLGEFSNQEEADTSSSLSYV